MGQGEAREWNVISIQYSLLLRYKNIEPLDRLVIYQKKEKRKKEADGGGSEGIHM